MWDLRLITLCVGFPSDTPAQASFQPSQVLRCRMILILSKSLQHFLTLPQRENIHGLVPASVQLVAGLSETYQYDLLLHRVDDRRLSSCWLSVVIMFV